MEVLSDNCSYVQYIPLHNPHDYCVVSIFLLNFIYYNPQSQILVSFPCMLFYHIRLQKIQRTYPALEVLSVASSRKRMSFIYKCHSASFHLGLKLFLYIIYFMCSIVRDILIVFSPWLVVWVFLLSLLSVILMKCLCNSTINSHKKWLCMVSLVAEEVVM
jgi:hypothetical protein